MGPWALAFLVGLSASAQEPAFDAGGEALSRAEEWRERLAKLIAEHRAHEPSADGPREECQRCAAGQNMVDDCYRVKADDLKGEESKSCDEKEGKCLIESRKPLARQCARRYQDHLCRAALTDPARVKALDQETRTLLSSCSGCCRERADWELKDAGLAADLAQLEAALARKDLPAMVGAATRAEHHRTCGWLCP